MAEQDGKADKHYRDWRQAEEQYAGELAAFGGDRPPTRVHKDSAMALAKARDRADRARDTYFKRVLK